MERRAGRKKRRDGKERKRYSKIIKKGKEIGLGKRDEHRRKERVT